MFTRFRPIRSAILLAGLSAAIGSPCIAAIARQEDAAQHQLSSHKLATINIPGDKLIVPFELAKSRTIPIVEAKVNGKGPFKFFFDTGAGICCFDTSFITELGLKADGKQDVGDPSNAKRINADRVKLDLLEIGAGKFSDFHVLAFDRQKFGAIEGIKGVIGLPLAAKHTLSIDYVSKTITFSNEALDRNSPGVVEYLPDQNLPEIPIEFAGKKLHAHLDTGAGTPLTLPEEFVKDLPKLSEPVVVGRGRTVNNEFEIKQVQLKGTLSLAGEKFENPVVSFHDRFPLANIGYGLLRDYIVSIDQRNHLARLQRVAKTPSALSVKPPLRRLGVFMTSRPDGSMEVSKLTANTLADRFGLKVGDVVQTINGKPFSSEQREALADAMANLKPVRIQVKRGDNQIEISIPEGAK